ncbi:P-loop containing nucleoside triphosphate hydrolase [Sesbania bispinosa]|nr:P-loop containing nucleoside triphosphate hydrolase [Sesbania bispinosa]
MGKFNRRIGTKDQMYVTEVYGHLRGNLCLVVLDNVSTTEDFDKLNEIFCGAGMTNGSRIVLTTRFKNVALHADSSSTPHRIRLLTEDESWELFQKVSNIEWVKLEPKVEKFAKEVLGRCGGLPLAILALGCVMLARGITETNLQWVLDRINQGQYKAHWERAWESITTEQFLKIKVLDLEHVFRPQLPESLNKLTDIKYLSLRGTLLEEFPLCICTLQQLETLDLKHTGIRLIPSKIWKMNKLKDLFLSKENKTRLEGKPSGTYHENVRTLSTLFLYGSYPLLRYLNKLKKLEKLKLAFQLTGSEQGTLASKIVQLKQLHSLILRSINEDSGPEKLILKNMSRLEKLSSLHLFGIIEDKPLMSHLPQNLTNLTLSASKLSDDPMTELQNLPKLKSLCLYSDSYMGKRMVCATGSFVRLQVLRFWNLLNLEEWDVKEGAMPCLIELEAGYCENLAFPIGLKHLKTLRMIKLHEMSESFVKDSLFRKKNLLADIEIYYGG